MRGARYLTPELAVAIFLEPGPLKNVAVDFGVSRSIVSYIKNGKRWGEATKVYSEAAGFNTMLITVACGVTP